MGKIHHSSLRLGGRNTFVAQLKSEQSGVCHEIELRKLRLSELMAALGEAEDIASRHVVGGEPLGVVDDQPVYVSNNASRIAATVAFAQTEFDESERYTAKELLHLMQDDELMACVLDAYEKCQPEEKPQKADDEKGNSQASSGNSPSLHVLES